jgi:hypothetical protein
LIRKGRLAVAGSLLAALLLSLLATSAGANHGILEYVSTGPTGGNGSFEADFVGASRDATHVVFITQERLVAADTDSAQDIYERTGGTTNLVSIGPNGGNAEVHAIFDGVSADGLHIYFHTKESLVSGDTDGSDDIYDRSGGTISQVSLGLTGGNGAHDAFFLDSSADGSKAFFLTYESLVPNDDDSLRKDVYERSGGVTRLVSTNDAGTANGLFGADWAGVSDDGNKVFFFTDEPLASSDTDGAVRDVYERSGGTTKQVSIGPLAGAVAEQASFGGATPDGSHVYFRTAEALTSEDSDSNGDVYERFAGSTTLVSTNSTETANGSQNANFSGVSSDGSKVFFATRESLVASDIDGSCEDDFGQFVLPCLDVYERSGGNTTLVSDNNAGTAAASADASFSGASPDGARVYFGTSERLAASDTDSAADVYERSGALTTHVSTSVFGSNGPHDANFQAASEDGKRIFFSTFESLHGNDTDGNWLDIYERFEDETFLVSIGPHGGSQAVVAWFGAASADGRRVVFSSQEKFLSQDTDTTQDVYAESVGLGYPRPQAAAQLRVPLMVAYKECTAPNKFHAPPLDGPSCDPALQESDFLTVGIAPARGAGLVKVTVCSSGTTASGICSTPSGMTAPDLRLESSLADVRCRIGAPAQPNCEPAAGGSDYTGQVQAKLKIRITDKHNSPTSGGSGEAGTATSVSLSFTLGCANNPAADPFQIGGTCAAVTRANAVAPGSVSGGKRSNWELGRIEVFDGGADGLAATADNTLYETQGVVVP